jgi:hypothetical protein
MELLTPPDRRDLSLFPFDKDKTLLEISRTLDREEQLMAEVNITLDELHFFLGADVSVTLHRDQRDRPSIFGHVELVTKIHIQLALATIYGKETKSTKSTSTTLPNALQCQTAGNNMKTDLKHMSRQKLLLRELTFYFYHD